MSMNAKSSRNIANAITNFFRLLKSNINITKSNDALRAIMKELQARIPNKTLTLDWKVSSGKGQKAFSQWIALGLPDFDVQKDRYVVYLFRSDMKAVYLCYAIGAAKNKKQQLIAMVNEATKKQKSFSNGFNAKIRDWNANQALSPAPAKWEHGIIASKMYLLSNLPTDNEFIRDLEYILQVYLTGGADLGTKLLDTDSLKDQQAPQNLIFYGPPGTGKTLKILKKAEEYTDKETDNDEPRKRYEFVTFHQNYGYEDFVEGIRPRLDKKTGQIKYVNRKGVLRRLIDRAEKDPSHRYAIFIDEINRGNISKIFGELITLIEPDKRAGGKYPVKIRLPTSGKLLSIPSNLDIFGTMNSVDRSVALVDMALRRRFKFETTPPDKNRVPEIIASDGSSVKMRDIFVRLNNKIELILGSEFCLGHSYFDKDLVEDLGALRSNWFGQVLPLIHEYLFDDWTKIKALVGDFVKSERIQLPDDDTFIRTECHRFVDNETMTYDGFCAAINSILK